MKKFLVYLCSIVVAVILGGVIGNLCVGIAPLSWLDSLRRCTSKLTSGICMWQT